MTAFQLFLEAWLRGSGLSRRQLAIKAGIHPNVLYAWFGDGPATPSYDNLVKLSPVVGKPPGELHAMTGRQPSDGLADDEREIMQYAEEFKAGLRGINRVWWAAIVGAWSAAAKNLRDVPAPPEPARWPVSAAEVAPDTAPAPTYNGLTAAEEEELRQSKQVAKSLFAPMAA